MEENTVFYRCEANGVRYQYISSPLHSEQMYSLISVPRNPRRKREDSPCRVLMVSDAHIGAEYGTWVTETPYRFYDGSHLTAWAHAVLRLPNRTPVTFHRDTHLEINGRLCTVLKDETVPFPAGTTLSFVNEMHISLPPETEVILPHGITTWERALILTDTILREWDKQALDCVFFLGDIISNEENKRKGDPNIDFHYWSLFKNRYLSRLTARGIPYFFVYANHDDLTDDEFAQLFPYTKNFAVSVDDTLFLAFDHFAKPNPENRRWGYGAPSDSDPDFLAALAPKVDAACACFLLSHYFPVDFKATHDFVKQHSSVLAAFEGHSHYLGPRVLAEGEPPFLAYEAGHFSWNGDEWGMASSDGTNKTGLPSGPFGFLILNELSCVDRDDLPAARAYHLFPEIAYGSCYGSGNIRRSATLYPPFFQERYMTDAEPPNSRRHHVIKKRKQNK